MYRAIELMLEDGLVSGKLKNSLSELMQLFSEWRKMLNAETPDEIATEVLEASGYIDMLKADKSVEAPGRLENLRELINVMSDTEKYPTLSEFMEHVSLVMDKDDITNENKVMLITLHSAKGLEFDVVFLPGWEEGLFPHQRALDEGGSEALEEERRLAYVAITRAKQKLYISMAHNRRVYGQWQNNLPSRFINELPSANLDICNNSSNYYSQNNYNYYQKSNKDYSSNVSSIYRNTYSNNRNQHGNANVIGTKVYHETFGYGKVVSNDGNSFYVCFEDGSIKKILGSYLSKL